MGLVATRTTATVTDNRVGLMSFLVKGKVGAFNRPYSLLYIIFRGSRGSIKGSGNPEGAGWGKDVDDHMRNLDWRSNFTTDQVVPSWSAASKVHKGFYEIYSSVSDQVKRAVTAALSTAPDTRIIVCGHSLGAALSVLCAHDLECSGTCHPFLFAFCCPRAGNLDFARDFNRKIADKKMSMPCERDAADYNRSFVFTQSNDLVSWGTPRGFETPMTEKEAKEIADSGSTAKQAWWGIRRKKSKTLIYYHVGNVYRASVRGLHSFEAMEKQIYGMKQ